MLVPAHENFNLAHEKFTSWKTREVQAYHEIKERLNGRISAEILA